MDFSVPIENLLPRFIVHFKLPSIPETHEYVLQIPESECIFYFLFRKV